jgi:uncharacterized membrane protein YhaH (DUF805 family)
LARSYPEIFNSLAFPLRTGCCSLYYTLGIQNNVSQLNFSQLKGENMESCNVWAQHYPQMTPVFVIVLAFLVAFVVMVILAIKLLICCKIFAKAGYSWALGLLMLIPIVNIIMAFFLAFADWPVRRELRSLNQKKNNITG